MLKCIIKSLAPAAGVLLVGAMLLGISSCSDGWGGSTGVAVVPKHPPVPLPYETKIGVAPYAIQHQNFECDDFIASLSTLKAYHLSWLWNTFGDRTDCLARVFSDPRLKSVQIHLFNETCVRNYNCGDYEALYGLTSEEITELAEVEEGWFKNRLLAHASLASSYLHEQLLRRVDVKCNISPGLESNTSIKGVRNIISWLRPLFPHCTFTHNSLSTLEGTGAEFIEHHNPYIPLPAPCYFNNDGVSITFPNYGSLYPRNFSSEEIPDINHRFQNCDVILWWHHSYNCINPRGFVDPRDRKCDEVVPFHLLGAELGKLQRN